MSLIPQIKRSVPTISETVDGQKASLINVNNTLSAGIASIFNGVFNNPNYTPQQVLIQWGTDAGALLQFLTVGQQVLSVVNPSYITLTTTIKTTTNPDGTVTVN